MWKFEIYLFQETYLFYALFIELNKFERYQGEVILDFDIYNM